MEEACTSPETHFTPSDTQGIVMEMIFAIYTSPGSWWGNTVKEKLLWSYLLLNSLPFQRLCTNQWLITLMIQIYLLYSTVISATRNILQPWDESIRKNEKSRIRNELKVSVCELVDCSLFKVFYAVTVKDSSQILATLVIAQIECK